MIKNLSTSFPPSPFHTFIVALSIGGSIGRIGYSRDYTRVISSFLPRSPSIRFKHDLVHNSIPLYTTIKDWSRDIRTKKLDGNEFIRILFPSLLSQLFLSSFLFLPLGEGRVSSIFLANDSRQSSAKTVIAVSFGRQLILAAVALEISFLPPPVYLTGGERLIARSKIKRPTG